MAHFAPATAPEIRDQLHRHARECLRQDHDEDLARLAQSPQFHAMLSEGHRGCLLEACLAKNAPRCAALLLSWGVKERKDAASPPLLSLARDWNRLAVAQALIEGGVDPDDLGPPVLLLSASGPRRTVFLGQPEFLSLRLRLGANPNHRGAKGELEPPLFHARSVDIALILLSAGADPSARGFDGLSPAARHRALGFERVAEAIEAFEQRSALSLAIGPAPDAPRASL